MKEKYPSVAYRQSPEPSMISFCNLLSLAPLGGLFHNSKSAFPVSLVHQVLAPPPRNTYMRALQRIYRERCSVHACIQQCTHEYTMVYTRVHFSFLGSRSTLGISRPRRQILLSSGYACRPHCPRTLVSSCIYPKF